MENETFDIGSGSHRFTTVKTQAYIWVTFARHGIHRYPAAPDQVAYLREPHRHLFKFKVMLSVTHDDREVEFHMLQTWLLSLFDSGVLELDYKSCEMLARELSREIQAKYGAWRTIEVEVSEDGECGAIVRHDPVSL